MEAEGGERPRVSLRTLFTLHWKTIAVWGAIAIFLVVALTTGLDKKVTALAVLIFGFLTQAFSGLLGLVGLIPVVGPLLVKVITLPFFLLVNGFAYLVTLFAVRRGKKMDVMKTRILVSSFLFGIVVGFILGKLI